MDDTKRALFLRKIHLFHDLKDDQLLQIGGNFSETTFDPGAVILEQGAVADSFYLIYSGSVRVYRRREGRGGPLRPGERSSRPGHLPPR